MLHLNMMILFTTKNVIRFAVRLHRSIIFRRQGCVQKFCDLLSAQSSTEQGRAYPRISNFMIDVTTDTVSTLLALKVDLNLN